MNPLRLILTGGQEADVTQGAALLEVIATGAAIADKGHYSDTLIEVIEASGAPAIIPPRSNRTIQRTTDWHRLPKASTLAWILVVSPPRERPIA